MSIKFSRLYLDDARHVDAPKRKASSTVTSPLPLLTNTVISPLTLLTNETARLIFENRFLGTTPVNGNTEIIGLFKPSFFNDWQLIQQKYKVTNDGCKTKLWFNPKKDYDFFSISLDLIIPIYIKKKLYSFNTLEESLVTLTAANFELISIIRSDKFNGKITKIYVFPLPGQVHGAAAGPSSAAGGAAGLSNAMPATASQFTKKQKGKTAVFNGNATVVGGTSSPSNVAVAQQGAGPSNVATAAQGAGPSNAAVAQGVGGSGIRGNGTNDFPFELSTSSSSLSELKEKIEEEIDDVQSSTNRITYKNYWPPEKYKKTMHVQGPMPPITVDEWNTMNYTQLGAYRNFNFYKYINMEWYRHIMNDQPIKHTLNNETDLLGIGRSVLAIPNSVLMFHGTMFDSVESLTLSILFNKSAPNSAMGNGFYLTFSPNEAIGYACQRLRDDQTRGTKKVAVLEYIITNAHLFERYVPKYGLYERENDPNGKLKGDYVLNNAIGFEGQICVYNAKQKDNIQLQRIHIFDAGQFPVLSIIKDGTMLYNANTYKFIDNTYETMCNAD